MPAALLLLIFPALVCPAQEEPDLELGPQPIVIDQTVIVRFTVRGLEPGDLRVETPEQLPDTVRLLGGPSLLPHSSEAPGPSGASKDIEVKWELRAVKAGRRIFPPIVYHVKGKRRETGAAVLEVARRGKPGGVPFDAAWRLPEPEPYAGQAFLALLEISNVSELVTADSVVFSPPAGLLMEEVKGLGTIATLGAGRLQLYRVPVAAYLATASKRGRVALPAARVVMRGVQEQAVELPVEVQALPEAAAASGAVGSFFYSSWLEAGQVPLGKSLVLHVRVEGEGNLHTLRLPEPLHENLLVVEKKPLQRFVPAERGYRGFVETVYRLQSPEPGSFSLKTAPFSWLDAQTRNLSAAPGKTFSATIAEKKSDTDGSAQDQPVFLGAGDALLHDGSVFYKDWRAYLLLLPGFGALALAALLRRRSARLACLLVPALLICLLVAADAPPSGEAEARLLVQAEKAYRAGDYRQCLLALLEVQRAHPGSAGLRYNLGVAHFRNGDKALAMHNLRQAVRQNPSDRTFREGLEKVEHLYGFEERIPLPVLPPDLWWAGFVAAANLALLAGAGMVRKLRAGRIIVLVLGLAACLACLAGLALEAGLAARPEGVVGPSLGDLKMIPRSDAKTWRLLEVGTSVEILSASGEFFFIRSALGIEGWLAATELVRD